MIIKDKRIKEEHPNGHRIIWRYMSLEKFLDIILNSQIFFTNLTKLTDRYEGTVFQTNYGSILSKIKDENVYEDQKMEMIIEQQQINNLRHYTLVNCWTIRQDESFALWKIYVGNNPGVAIRTTISNLKKSINNTPQDFDEDISYAAVKYQDILDDRFSRIEATITKKKFYDFESEMRLIIFNFPISEGGYTVPYDINIGRMVNISPDILIAELYISPFLSKPYRKTISDAICKIAPYLTDRIKSSQVNDT